MQESTRPRRNAFTLIELLVVMVIIVILASILVPIISKVRQAAYAASSASQVQSISALIQQYYLNFNNSYPGPLGDDQMGPGVNSGLYDLGDGVAGISNVTGSENLVLGLLGGLKVEVTNPGPPPTVRWDFDWTLVGQGPRSLSTGVPKRSPSFGDAKDLSWTDGQPTGGPNAPGPTINGKNSGLFADDVTPDRANVANAIDSVIPEFVDRFPNPMPLLYLRAHIGAANVVSFRTPGPPPGGVDSANAPQGVTQYDLNQILAYTDPDGQRDNNTPPTGNSIGVGKNFDEYNVNGTPTKVTNRYHGLRTVNTSSNMTTPGTGYYMPADAYPYFTNPAVPNTARMKDAYLLISAGKDRVYGTADDILSSGTVFP